MISHKAVVGYYFGESADEKARVIGCYESFDSANNAAREYVLERYERACEMQLGATVITVTGKRVVYYQGNYSRMTADTGPSDLEERKQHGWDVP